MDLNLFEKQLIDVAAIWALTYRIHSIHGFIGAVPEIMTEPSSSEWRRVHQEVSLGLHMGEALRNLRDRVPSPGMDLLLEMYENSGTYLKVEAIDEAVLILWERYDPATIPENASVKVLMTLTNQLRNRNIHKHEDAIRQFLEMGDRAIPYLVDYDSLTEDRLPATINLLKILGSEGAQKNLKRFTRFKWIKPGHGAILKSALDEYGIAYRPTIETSFPCKTCGRASADTAGAYCWFCNEYVCEDHVLKTDRNPHAAFCSEAHLWGANNYLGFWI